MNKGKEPKLELEDLKEKDQKLKKDEKQTGFPDFLTVEVLKGIKKEFEDYIVSKERYEYFKEFNNNSNSNEDAPEYFLKDMHF